MKKCLKCGLESDLSPLKCPSCGAYYSKVIELIDEEAEREERLSFRARCKRIMNSENIKQELIEELTSIKDGLSGKAKFTLFVIFAFVFALVVSVL